MIRLMVVDDHNVVRAGIESLFVGEDDIEVVGTASDGAEAVAAVATLSPDVVLMDLSMPVMDGTAATREIAAAHPAVKVVVLTSFAEDDRVVGALQAGALGYTLKDADPTVIVGAVRAAAGGGVPIDPRVASALVPQRAARSDAQLTDREEEIVRLVAEGLVNKQIAAELGIAEKTVKTHLTNAFKRLGVSGREEAAAWVHAQDARTGRASGPLVGAGPSDEDPS